MAKRRQRVKRISRRSTLDTDTAVSFAWRPSFGSIERRRALQIIRDEAARYVAFDPSLILVIRGKGGTRDYKTRWWSSPPIEAGELLPLADDELSDFLYGLHNPGELDIYARIG